MLSLSCPCGISRLAKSRPSSSWSRTGPRTRSMIDEAATMVTAGSTMFHTYAHQGLTYQAGHPHLLKSARMAESP